MNIIEALKSGKRFRRAGFQTYYSPGIHDAYFCYDEIIATDWEVEEKTITITEEQLLQAWKKANTDAKLVVLQNWTGITTTSRPELYDILKKELGL